MGVLDARECERGLEGLYRRLRAKVLARAHRWFPAFTEADLEDIYQAAWLSAIRTRSEVNDLEGYVLDAAYSQGLMELRRRRRKPADSLDAEAEGPQPDRARLDKTTALLDRTAALPDEEAETRVLAGLVGEVLDELSARQRRVIKLRWGFGLSRREIAAALGISEREVKRDLRRAAPALAQRADLVASGGWCGRKRSLITAYALELLSPRRAAAAERHLHGCAACRLLVHELRQRAGEVAALTPAPALADASHHHPLSALGQLLDAARGHAEGAAAHTKQHAASLAARVSDPTPLAGARPGAAAAALAGCIALGGGAYCAVHGLPDPIKPVLGVEHHIAKRTPKPTPSYPAAEPASPAAQPAPRQPARAIAKPTPPPKPTPTPISKPTPTPTPPPSPPQPKSQAAPPPPKQPTPAPPPSEFFGQPAPPRASAHATSSPPSSPAPATSQGEFDGP
jgi:RNA polymerase sigma factor (sigma-70 family)